MRKMLLMVASVMLLTGCGSSSVAETTAPAVMTEPETSLVARENIQREMPEPETEEILEETEAEIIDPVTDVNGYYEVERYDFKNYYKNIKASEYAKYNNAIIVDQVIPNNVASDYGEQILSWEFNYQEYNYSGLSAVYEQVPEIARYYAVDGVNTCLSVYFGGKATDLPYSVTYAAIDNTPGKGWEKSIIFSLENVNDPMVSHILFVIFTTEQDRAVRVALFDAREYNKSDLSEYSGYKGPTMTLNPDTNESFDVIGTMPLGESDYLNRIKE